MKLTTTFRLLRKASASPACYELLQKSLPREEYTDDTPINLLTILETNGLDDAIWALSATAENCEKVARLMAADFAEQVLPLWQKYSQDKRPELAIKAARDFAHGLITILELAAARAAVWAAAAAADALVAAPVARDALNAARASARASAPVARAAWAAARASWAARDAARDALDAADDADAALDDALDDADDAPDAALAAAAAWAAWAARAAARDKQREIFVRYLQEGD